MRGDAFVPTRPRRYADCTLHTHPVRAMLYGRTGKRQKPGRGRLLVRVLASTIAGIDAIPVEVETDISKGLPSYTIVGLPGGAVRESADRVRAAIRNSG